MLGKTSVSMMVFLVVAASLIGISSIHQYIEGQAPSAKVPQQKASGSGYGTVTHVRMFDSSAGKACTAALRISQGLPNSLGLKPGTIIDLLAPNEHFCTLFVLSKVGQIETGFEAQNIKATTLPPAVRGTLVLPENHPYLYKYLNWMYNEGKLPYPFFTDLYKIGH
jgi:hypothetical protein